MSNLERTLWAIDFGVSAVGWYFGGPYAALACFCVAAILTLSGLLRKDDGEAKGQPDSTLVDSHNRPYQSTPKIRKWHKVGLGASIVGLIVLICFGVVHKLRTANPQTIVPTPVASQPPFRIAIKYIRTDWGHTYNPRTLFMSYYYLNGSPRLSPIDLWIDLRIINLQSEAAEIEAWSIETAPTPDGPWLELVHIPSSPHFTIYLVGDAKNQKTNALIFPDLQDALSQSVSPGKEADGWALCECPFEPPCLGWYERIRVRDARGNEYAQVISLSDYNGTATDNQPDIEWRVSKAPPRDMTRVSLLRPFPTKAYRLEPPKEGGVTRLFMDGSPTPPKKRL